MQYRAVPKNEIFGYTYKFMAAPQLVEVLRLGDQNGATASNQHHSNSNTISNWHLHPTL